MSEPSGVRAYVCPECGLDYATITPEGAVFAIRAFPALYRELLNDPELTDGPDGLIRQRPNETTWSALEYTAHVADLLDNLGPTINRITAEDEPSIVVYPNDARAVDKAYNAQSRSEVLGWLDLVCADLASILEAVKPDDWGRIAHFGAGDLDVLTMARSGVHEGSHHLADAERVLAAVQGRPA